VSRLSSASHLALCVSQLQDASKWLQRSFEQCQPIDVTKPLTAEQYDALENLSSRFARVVDILINKLYRAIDVAELLEAGSLIDTINRAVKRGLLEDNQTARTLKDIRNEIVHEYVVEDLKNLQLEILRYTTILLELVKVALSYIDDKQLTRQAD